MNPILHDKKKNCIYPTVRNLRHHDTPLLLVCACVCHCLSFPSNVSLRSDPPRPGVAGAITYSSDGVQSCVSADAEVWARHIVGDSGGDHDHGHTELVAFAARRLQFQQRQEGLQGRAKWFFFSVRCVCVEWKSGVGSGKRRKEKQVPRERAPGSITADGSETDRSRSTQIHWIHYCHIQIHQYAKLSQKKIKMVNNQIGQQKTFVKHWSLVF